MTKSVRIEIALHGDGTIRESKPGVFTGGVPSPDLSDFSFEVWDENAAVDAPPLQGQLQINMIGTSAGYHELGRYFLALSELQTGADPDFHDHLDGLLSADGRTVLHFIFRKFDELAKSHSR